MSFNQLILNELAGNDLNFMAPFKSRAQMRYLYANKPALAKEFANKTKSLKELPEHVRKKKKKK